MLKNKKKSCNNLGNPVSAIVTFNLVVVPCLKTLVGYRNPFFREIKVKVKKILYVCQKFNIQLNILLLT